MSKCLFVAAEYPYVWSTTQHKGWTQRKCSTCGLWTVHRHTKTTLTATRCDGRELFWANYRAIEKVGKEFNH